MWAEARLVEEYSRELLSVRVKETDPAEDPWPDIRTQMGGKVDIVHDP